MGTDQPYASSLTMAVRDIKARLDAETRQDLSAVDLTPIIEGAIRRGIEWWQARCPRKTASQVRDNLRAHPKTSARLRTFVAEELRSAQPQVRKFGKRLAFTEARDRVHRAILESIDGSTDDRIMEVLNEVDPPRGGG